MIVDSAMKIHKELGPGLLESVYEVVLARALEKRGFQVARQNPIRFEYDGMVFEDGFRVDLLVDGRVIVELKSVENLAPVHSKQLLTYLRLMNLSVGLLINFGAATLKEGLHRMVNKIPSSASPREPIPSQPMNEAETRAEHIDPAMKAAGWGIVAGSRIRREYSIAPGRIEGHGRRGKPLTADYVVKYRNTKLAALEALKKSLLHQAFA
jgi:iron complex transport system substrate-binding protein